MKQLLAIHDALLQRRTSIRNSPVILIWMRKCWSRTARARVNRMARHEYEFFYSKLLRRMLSEWNDRHGAVVLGKMWGHDACSFGDLNFDRFSCSIFFFAEMWVDEVTVAEYVRIFEHLHRILSSEDSASPATRSTTLSAFLDALTTQLDMERDNASIGRSIIFDAARFEYRSGGLSSLLLDTTISQEKRPLRSAPGTRRNSDSGAGASHCRRTSTSMEAADVAKYQLQATPSFSRPTVQGRDTGCYTVAVVPKRIELLSRRNRGRFCLDA